MKTFKEYQSEKVKKAVYSALEQVSFELDASEEEMKEAIRFFEKQFYQDNEE